MKYGDSLGGADMFKPDGGFTMQSTDIYRTIQSGYSEILGMLSNSGLASPELSPS